MGVEVRLRHLIAERHPTPAPAPERIASTKRELADFHIAQMEREAGSWYVTELRVRAAVLVRR